MTASTLTMDLLFFALVSLLQIVGYCTVRNWLYSTPSPADSKRRAWLLSLALSGFFSFIVYPWVTLPALAAVFTGPEAFRAFLAAETPLHRFMALYFLSEMVLDCAIGVLDYKEHLRPDTTWLHHIVISLILLLFLRTNSTLLFLLCAPFEVPTFILSLGTIFPAYRNDTLFGATFFFYRIFYETILIVYLWFATDVGATVLAVAGGPTLTFHLFWFWKWQKAYRQKLEGGGAAKEAKLDASSSSSSSSSASASHAPTSSSVSGLLAAAIGAGDLEVGSEVGKGAPEPKIHPPPEVKVGSPMAEKAEGGGKPVRLPPPPVRNKERQA